VFPVFVAERLVRRWRERRHGARRRHQDGLPRVSPMLDRILVGISRVESRVLARTSLPFGSSVFLAATKSAEGPSA
jgi:hypothetical protein